MGFTNAKPTSQLILLQAHQFWQVLENRGASNYLLLSCSFGILLSCSWCSSRPLEQTRYSGVPLAVAVSTDSGFVVPNFG
jgi:hypothetical protein